jgi:hypothetical protein
MCRFSWLFLLAGSVFLPAAPPNEPGAQPYSLDRLLKIISDIHTRKTNVTDNILKWQLKKVGLSFQLTSAHLETLKRAGASEDVLKAIETAPQPPVLEVPEPPKVRNGYLRVLCEPADCNIWLNGKELGTGAAGTALTLPEGSVTVRVAKEDYEADAGEKNVVIKGNEAATVEFKLRPTRAALERTGGQKFKQMIEALGGEAGLKELDLVRMSGALTVFDHDGKPTGCDFAALLKFSDKVGFQVRRSGQKYDIAWTAVGGYEWKHKARDLGNLQDALDQFRQHELKETIERLRSPGTKMIAASLTPSSGEDTVLRAQQGAATVVIVLDRDFRPQEIRTESSGMDSGRRIRYGDYVNCGHAFYPKTSQIMLPGAAQYGVDVLLTNVEVLDAVAMNKKGALNARTK